MGTNPTEPRKPTLWSRFRLVVLVPLARLRFLFILGAIGLVIAKWDWLDRPVREDDPARRPRPSPRTTSSTSARCTRPWSATTTRRSARSASCRCRSGRRARRPTRPLPAGTVARVQLSPYRVVLAGVRTAPVGYPRAAPRDHHRRHGRVRRARTADRGRPVQGADRQAVRQPDRPDGARRATRSRRSTARTWSSPCRTCSTPGRRRTRTWRRSPATA